MRSIFSHSASHVCDHRVVIGLATEAFEKSCEAQLAKGRIKPVTTRVGKYVERRSPKVARLANAVLRAVAGKVAKQVAALYAKLTKADTPEEIVKRILEELDLEGISVDLVDAITPELIAAFEKAGILGVGQVGFTVDEDITKHLDRKARDYAEQRGGQLIKDLAGTTRDDLQGLLARGIEEGMSPDELSDEVQKMGAFGEARGDMIARTELAFAHVEGNMQGWRETEMVEGKESVLGDLHDVPDECDECADAGVVPLEADFIPGLKQPPYHPNCICDILPVLKPSEESEGA